jgi:hypothetical protein
MASTLNAITTGPGGITFNGDTSGAMALQTLNGNTAVYVDTSQNVGIGTSSPSQKLEVATASGGTIGLRYIGNSGYATVGTNGNNEILFSNGNPPTERMRIDSSGNIQIKGTGGTSTFNVFGNSTFTDQLRIFNVPTSGGSGQQGILFRNTYNTGGSIFSMGAATTNDLILWYGGNGTQGSITGNGAGINYSSASDYRLKENVAPMVGALAKIAQLKPCTYTWKFNGSDGQGFIAHELQSVFPDAVTGEKDAVETYTDEDGNEQTKIKAQGVDTSFLVATLTAAIQELKAINDTQAETINALTARIETLEKK